MTHSTGRAYLYELADRDQVPIEDVVKAAEAWARRYPWADLEPPTWQCWCGSTDRHEHSWPVLLTVGAALFATRPLRSLRRINDPLAAAVFIGLVVCALTLAAALTGWLLL